jgi:hypothetical protein
MTSPETRTVISAATAMARLEVSYGMSRLGARRLLDEARRNGSARTGAVRVTFISHYPESYTISEANSR